MALCRAGPQSPLPALSSLPPSLAPQLPHRLPACLGREDPSLTTSSHLREGRPRLPEGDSPHRLRLAEKLASRCSSTGHLLQAVQTDRAFLGPDVMPRSGLLLGKAAAGAGRGGAGCLPAPASPLRSLVPGPWGREPRARQGRRLRQRAARRLHPLEGQGGQQQPWLSAPGVRPGEHSWHPQVPRVLWRGSHRRLFCLRDGAGLCPRSPGHPAQVCLCLLPSAVCSSDQGFRHSLSGSLCVHVRVFRGRMWLHGGTRMPGCVRVAGTSLGPCVPWFSLCGCCRDAGSGCVKVPSVLRARGRSGLLWEGPPLDRCPELGARLGSGFQGQGQEGLRAKSVTC